MRISTRTRTVRRLLVICCLCAAVLSGLACTEQNTAEEAPPANEAPASDGSPGPSAAAPSTEPDGNGTQGAQQAATPATEPATAQPAHATAEEIAKEFLWSYGAFDVERAITYLADDADISELVGSVGAQGLTGTLDQFRLLIAFLEGQSYKQILRSCEGRGSSASGTKLRCTFDFHAIRSDEIGLGPFSSTHFDLTVSEGEIVRASNTWETGEFSPQLWEPFADWVSTAYPEDAEVMYTGGLSGARLTEESIRLWEQRSREYADVEIASMAPTRRLSRVVDGVAFSFSLPTMSGWTPGPIERLADASGFRNGKLYISQSTVGPQAAEAVVFWTSFPDGDRADPCANLLSPPIGPSTADLAEAVATAPGTKLVAGPSNVTVGGAPAKHVVLTVRTDVGCDPGFFYTWHDERWGPFWPGTDVGNTIRVWIVDVGGTRLFIEAETIGSGPDLEQEIQQIVESIRFD